MVVQETASPTENPPEEVCSASALAGDWVGADMGSGAQVLAGTFVFEEDAVDEGSSLSSGPES